MNLYIIRHGESTWNSKNRIQGNSNPPLSRLGMVQAKLLAKRFRKIKIDKIYSSPFLRSLQTAQIIAKVLKLKVVKRGALKEVGLGEWEGKSPDEIDRLYDNNYQRWLRYGPTKIKIPGAENIASFRKRVKRVFYDIIKENKDRDILVVTHGGVIAAFLAHLLDADFDKLILALHLPNTCVTLISIDKDRSYLIHIADTAHLFLKNAKGIWPNR
ncbi:MAG: histidine phosphatase family protein [Candidatus Omnitrophica bacterium]|nr:histidine phosphatase family protein [Candidatus Omnitrophota bacterium]